MEYLRNRGDFSELHYREQDNAQRVFRAPARFGAPLHGLSYRALTEPDVVFQVDIEPLRVGVLTDISGVQFAQA